MHALSQWELSMNSLASAWTSGKEHFSSIKSKRNHTHKQEPQIEYKINNDNFGVHKLLHESKVTAIGIIQGLSIRTFAC